MKIDINNKIRQLCKERRISLKELAEGINITQTGLQGILKNNSTSLDKLIEIVEFFKVPVGTFFDEPEAPIGNGVNMTATGNNNKQSVALNDCHHKVALLEKEIEGLKKEIEGKDKIIGLLERSK